MPRRHRSSNRRHHHRRRPEFIDLRIEGACIGTMERDDDGNLRYPIGDVDVHEGRIVAIHLRDDDGQLTEDPRENEETPERAEEDSPETADDSATEAEDGASEPLDGDDAGEGDLDAAEREETPEERPRQRRRNKRRPNARQVVDARGMSLLPGLIDPHTHLVFAGDRTGEFAQRLAGVDYRDIAAQGGGIKGTVRATRNASDEELWRLTARRARALRASGVTTVEIKSGYGLSTEEELRLLRVARRVEEEGILRVYSSFLGAHAIPPEFADDRAGYVREIIEEMIPAVVDEDLADACDVYCDEGAFTLEETRRILEAAKDAGLSVRAHVGQFADLGGPELLADLDAVSADHLEQVSDEGLAAMAEAGVIAVLLPGAWSTLGQQAPLASRFREAGVKMAIGTDCNPGTSPTTDLPLMAALACRDAKLTTDEALLGITRHAAWALNAKGGRISVSQRADLALYNVSHPRALPYALGGLRPHRVWRKGRLVHRGDRDIDAVW